LDLIREIRETYEREKLRDATIFYDDQLLKDNYELFRSRFGPEQLQSLDGEALLENLFNHSNRDSLVYWLEFKNDDEFSTNAFGGIGGGSAFKFGIFRRSDDGEWITGHPKDMRIVGLSEAVQIARNYRDLLVKGAELIGSMPNSLDDTSYLKLQDDLEKELGGFSDLVWVHKYFHMLFPEKIDTFHNTELQTFYLIKLLQKPVKQGARYAVAGQFLRFAKQAGLSMNNFGITLKIRFGLPHEYWRVGTTDGKTKESYWTEMRENGYVSVGWQALGNLRRFDDLSDSEARSQLRELVAEAYPSTQSAVTRSARQLFNFYRRLKPGDIVVAAQGKKFLGIGRVIGEYEYSKDYGFPHFKRVRWLVDGGENLPEPNEGLQTTIHKYRSIENLLEIERRLRASEAVSYVDDELAPHIARIQSILERKRQVILYGPPGTGKTYWAEQAALELASRKAFNKPYSLLEEEERAVILGDGKNSGLVRLCCFHPSYGYEDFVEGIRAGVAGGQTVFSIRDGIFKSICADARDKSDRVHFLIIDEINRGDISRIFGELITLIEVDKRGKELILPISGERFSVPDNLYIIGTMNTADRSIALLDAALRRRFGFYELMPDYSLLEGITIQDLPLGVWLRELNKRIVLYVGRDARNLQIGHSYFMHKGAPIKNADMLRKVVFEDVIPLLEEYCYGDYDTIGKIIGRRFVDSERQRINTELFEPENTAEFINALIEADPTIVTSSVVRGEDELDEDNDDNEDDSGEEQGI